MASFDLTTRYQTAVTELDRYPVPGTSTRSFPYKGKSRKTAFTNALRAAHTFMVKHPHGWTTDKIEIEEKRSGAASWYLARWDGTGEAAYKHPAMTHYKRGGWRKIHYTNPVKGMSSSVHRRKGPY